MAIATLVAFKDFIKKFPNCPAIQIFLHSSETLDLAWDVKHIQFLIDSGKPIINHSIYKMILGKPYSYRLFWTHYRNACDLGLYGVVVHLPNLGVPLLSDFILTMFNLFLKNNKEVTHFPIVFFEHIPKTIYIEQKNLKYLIDNLNSRMIGGFSKLPIGLCVDTCHCYVSGIPLTTENEAKTYIEPILDIVQNDIPLMFHLNDSESEFNSGKDRHAGLGTKIWKDDQSGLAYIVNLCKANKYNYVVELKGLESMYESYQLIETL